MAAPFLSFSWMSAEYWQLIKGESSSASTFLHGNFTLAIPVSELVKKTYVAFGPAQSNVSGPHQWDAGHPGRSLRCILSITLNLSALVLTELCIFYFLCPQNWNCLVRQETVQRESLVIKLAASSPRELGCSTAFATKFFILCDDGEPFVTDTTKG